MINAIKRIIQGDEPLASIAIATGAVATAELGASAVTGAKIAASAVAADGLKYKLNTYSFLGTASAANGASACSATYTISTTGKIIGHYLTKLTSHANHPVFTQGTNSIAISVAQTLIGSDVVEGVIITIEA